MNLEESFKHFLEYCDENQKLSNSSIKQYPNKLNVFGGYV